MRLVTVLRTRLFGTLRGIGEVLWIFVEHPILILALVIVIGILKSAVS